MFIYHIRDMANELARNNRRTHMIVWRALSEQFEVTVTMIGNKQRIVLKEPRNRSRFSLNLSQ